MKSETTQDPSREKIAAILPGRWHVRATTSPAWLTGARDSPIFEYKLLSSDPLILSGEVSWIALRGDEKRMLGTHHWDDNRFVWRRSQTLPAPGLQWWVPAIGADGNILIARFGRIHASAAGIDILARAGVDIPQLRSLVSRAPAEFGLTADEVALVSWMVPSDDR